MISLEEFLTGRAEEVEANPALADALQIDVILSRLDDQRVALTWLGTTFEVRNEDVVGVADASGPLPNPTGHGMPARVALRPDAELVITRRVTARDVLAGLPLVLHAPGAAPEAAGGIFTEREESWLQTRGIPTDWLVATSQSRTDTQSSQVTATRTSTSSNGMSDDSAVDDTPSDSMGRDDSSVDDIAAQDHRQTTTYTSTQSSQVTATRTTTQSGGVSDDSSVDDTPSDSMGSDDSTQDDFSNQ